MQVGRQWIHFDAQFPLGFGHDLCERFGPAGELLFVQFLCACKRSFPQGQIRYRTDDEARLLLGASYPFVDGAGAEWSFADFWKWCGRHAKTRTTTRNGRTTVTATRWEAWEDAKRSKDAERKRRSRANSVRGRPRLRGEVGGVRIEVGGGSVRGESAGPAPASSQGADAAPASKNGAGRPDPAALVALVESIEAQAGDLPEQP